MGLPFLKRIMLCSLAVRVSKGRESFRREGGWGRSCQIPIAHVIAKFLVKDRLASVVGVEVKVEGVNDVGAFVIDNDAAG